MHEQRPLTELNKKGSLFVRVCLLEGAGGDSVLNNVGYILEASLQKTLGATNKSIYNKWKTLNHVVIIHNL